MGKLQRVLNRNAIEAYMARHGVTKQMLNAYMETCVNDGIEKGDEIHIQRLYICLATLCIEHLHFGQKRTYEMIKAFDKVFGEIKTAEDWTKKAEFIKERIGLEIEVVK